MQKAHFIGICGAGMSAVAKLLKEQGWVVSGSDEGFYPPISNYLEANHLPCATPYAAKNIPSDVELIVIGKNAKLVPETNPEVAAAFQLNETKGIRIASFPEVLRELTAHTTNYVIAGSFGKSTCATLLAWTLIHAQKDPSYFLGAVPLNFDTNAHLGTGKTFILEGDEYPSANWDARSKFLHYNPSSVLLTSAEHDHLNVFPTIEAYLKPYRELISIIPQSGRLIACLDGEHVRQLVNEASCPITTYSFSREGGGDWHAANIERGKINRFDLMHRNEPFGSAPLDPARDRQGKLIATIETQLLGDHNIQNMVGVATLLLAERAVTAEQLVRAFREFRGVKRRLELKTPATTLPVYEDYGSSRAKAEAGFKTIRQYYPNKKMIVVFEPHTFSWRNRNALPWYDTIFRAADVVYLFQPATQGAGTHEQLTQAEIVERVRVANTEIHGVSTKEELLEQLAPTLTGNEVIIMSTSGDMAGAIEAVTEYINQNYKN